jgi:PKHD-type hydroxylase
MMLQAPSVLSKAQVAEVRALIDAGEWIDGNLTSGPQAKLAKVNEQLLPRSAQAAAAGEIILAALRTHPLFVSAALPRTIMSPLFNRYGAGQTFGNHVDNAVRADPLTGQTLRTDLSATLFLSEPDDYDGGELTVEDTFGVQGVKLPAGDLILYPSSSIHHVTPVTRGSRTAAFFWIQSLIRDDAQRVLLLNLDVNIQKLTARLGGGAEEVIGLTGTYHNLLRLWAEV